MVEMGAGDASHRESRVAPLSTRSTRGIVSLASDWRWASSIAPHPTSSTKQFREDTYTIWRCMGALGGS